MARRTQDERVRAVLEAAAEHVRSARIEWASSLTFNELASATEIDQAQIVRDFGSKEQLVSAVIEFMLEPSNYDPEPDDEPWPCVGDDTVAVTDRLRGWAIANESMQRNKLEQIRAERMLWSSAEQGSEEWRHVGQVYRTLLNEYSRELKAMLGADDVDVTDVDELTLDELTVLTVALVEGLLVIRSVAPDLVADDLSGKALTALAGRVTRSQL